MIFKITKFNGLYILELLIDSLQGLKLDRSKHYDRVIHLRYWHKLLNEPRHEKPCFCMYAVFACLQKAKVQISNRAADLRLTFRLVHRYSPRARNTFNQVVEAKRFKVYSYVEKYAEFKNETLKKSAGTQKCYARRNTPGVGNFSN